MLKNEKETVVEELQKVFSEAKGVYLTDFTGINVSMVNELRKNFRDGNVEFRVVKNTLARRSLRGSSLDGLLQHLIGPTALAYSDKDSMAPAKIIDKFRKKTDLLSIKAAVVDGVVFDQEDMEKIVKLPSRNELVAKMLGSLNAPITGIVGVLSGVLRNFVGVLSAVKDKKEQEGDPSGKEHQKQPDSKAVEQSDRENESAGTGKEVKTEAGSGKESEKNEKSDAEPEKKPGKHEAVNTGDEIAQDTDPEASAEEQKSGDDGEEAAGDREEPPK